MSAPPQEKPVIIISLSHPIVRFGWMPQGTTGGPVPPPEVRDFQFIANVGKLMGH